jgi:hypothetical protein
LDFGLVGEDFSGYIENSFWDTETSGLTYSTGGTGLPTGDMQKIHFSWFPKGLEKSA